MTRPTHPEYILTFSCPDHTGLVHAVTSWLVAVDGNIIDSDQFGDPDTSTFFMRVHFDAPGDLAALEDSFAGATAAHRMDWQIWPAARKPRVLIMVSKTDHCLLDLLYRVRLGELAIDVPLVVSNHPDTGPQVAASGASFLHLPVTPASKAEQEAQVLAAAAEHRIDLVVLARYMQVLSPAFCQQLAGRIINIHHSFLPGFKGARPYHQAHRHGVKLIGATAHFVTADLDEGPIIEQDVRRVDHRQRPSELAAAGRDVERMVLARAVRWVAEQRVLQNGNRTVVFA